AHVRGQALLAAFYRSWVAASDSRTVTIASEIISAAVSTSSMVLNFPTPMRSALSWASADNFIARRTCDGVRAPELHAEPDEIATCRESLAMTASAGAPSADM